MKSASSSSARATINSATSDYNPISTSSTAQEVGVTFNYPPPSIYNMSRKSKKEKSRKSKKEKLRKSKKENERRKKQLEGNQSIYSA